MGGWKAQITDHRHKVGISDQSSSTEGSASTQGNCQSASNADSDTDSENTS